MRERPSRIEQLGGLALSVARSVYRRLQSPKARVVVYDDDGRPRALERDSAGFAELTDTAARLVSVTESSARFERKQARQ